MSLEDQVQVNSRNREPRQPLVLLVDVSESMRNDIGDVQSGLEGLQHELQNDPVARNRVELAVITFGGTVQLLGGFEEAAGWVRPGLTAQGDTPMSAAIDKALDLVESKKLLYRQHGLEFFRPWIFLVTDGAPTDEPLWPGAVARVTEAERRERVALFSVGTESADFNRLRQISPARDPIRLKSGEWRKMFIWLSRSVSAKSKSKPQETVPLVDPMAPNGWAVAP
jgi:uncharacterized protein YegL